MKTKKKLINKSRKQKTNKFFPYYNYKPPKK